MTRRAILLQTICQPSLGLVYYALMIVKHLMVRCCASVDCNGVIRRILVTEIEVHQGVAHASPCIVGCFCSIPCLFPACPGLSLLSLCQNPSSHDISPDLSSSQAPDPSRGMSRASQEIFLGMSSVFPRNLIANECMDREHVAIEAPPCHK